MKMSPRQRGPRQPHFFWQGALILLPVALLAVFSLASLRRDELAAEQDARNRAAQNVQSLARAMRLTANDELQRFLTLQNVWMIGLRLAGQPTVSGVFPDEKLRSDIRKWEESFPGLKFTDLIVQQGEVLTDGRQIEPPDIPAVPQPPEWFRQLSPKQMVLWETLRGSVDTKASPASIKTAFEAFRDSNPSDDARQAAYYLSDSPEQIAENSGALATETGLSFEEIACYRLLSATKAQLSASLFQSVWWQIIDHASTVSPKLLELAGGIDQSGRCSPPAKSFLDATVLGWPVKNPRMAWSRCASFPG